MTKVSKLTPFVKYGNKPANSGLQIWSVRPPGRGYKCLFRIMMKWATPIKAQPVPISPRSNKSQNVKMNAETKVHTKAVTVQKAELTFTHGQPLPPSTRVVAVMQTGIDTRT